MGLLGVWRTGIMGNDRVELGAEHISGELGRSVYEDLSSNKFSLHTHAHTDTQSDRTNIKIKNKIETFSLFCLITNRRGQQQELSPLEDCFPAHWALPPVLTLTRHPRLGTGLMEGVSAG